MLKKVYFNFRGKNLKIVAKLCSFFSLGLILKTRNTMPCIFEFKRPTSFKISSLFVFFPFVAVWLDGKNKVIEIKKVRPFTFSIGLKKPFYKIIEIPINPKYKNKVKVLLPRR